MVFIIIYILIKLIIIILIIYSLKNTIFLFINKDYIFENYFLKIYNILINYRNFIIILNLINKLKIVY